MQRELNTFPIAQHVQFKLYSNGFTVADDLRNLGPVELAKETMLTKEEALEVLETVFFDNDKKNIIGNNTFCASALDVLLEEKSKPPVPTFCEALDNLLGGGIPLKKVTELCGLPGTGKTQMCLQLCANIHIPSVCGGLQGEAIFIDTEGNFIVDRLIQIADSAVDACVKIMRTSNPSVSIDSFSTRSILEGLYYFHCTNYIELIARVHLIPEFLEKHPKVRLLIIDSISFHFRYGFEDSYARRIRLLNGLSQSLVKICNDFNMAIVVTNQMTMKIQQEAAKLVPALGESWGHSCTVRIILSWLEGKRQAFLFKSPWKEEGTALFQITVSGVRDYSSLTDNDESLQVQELHRHKKPKICD